MPRTEPDYVLTWTVDREDLREALSWRLWHSSRSRPATITFCVCGLIGAVLLVWRMVHGENGALVLPVILTLFPLLLVALPRWQAGSMLRGNPTLREPTRLSLTGAGIDVDRRVGSGHTAWAGFSGVEESNRSYLLRYTGMRMDLVIPKRAVDGDAGAFRNYLDRHIGTEP